MAFASSLEIWAGATFRQRFEWRDAGLPVDLSGWTALAHVRLTADAPDILVNLSTENGGIVLGGALGTIDLFIHDEETSAFTFTNAVWDISLKDTNDEIYPPLIEGKVQVFPMVTQWP
jgi:hypothetical protein